MTSNEALDLPSKYRALGLNESKAYEEQIAQKIWSICSPIILAVGTVGSLLSILVLTRRQFHRITILFYLIILAVADLGVLYTGLMRLWLQNVFHVYIRDQSTFACKFHTFMTYFMFDFYVWILVTVTADRSLRVTAPLAARKWCTLNRARIIVCVIAAACVVASMHFFWTEEISFTNGTASASCETSERFHGTIYETDTWTWFDFCIVCLVPFIVMLVCNGLIIRKVGKSTKQIRVNKEMSKELSAFHGSKSEANAQTNRHHSNEPCAEHTRNWNAPLYAQASQIEAQKNAEQGQVRFDEHMEEHSSSSEIHVIELNHYHNHRPPHDNCQSSERKIEGAGRRTFRCPCRMPNTRHTLCSIPSITVMLVTINTLFWLLTAPLAVFLMCCEPAEQPLSWSVVNMLQYTNNAIHFFLYCMTGSRFRREFITMCKRSPLGSGVYHVR